MSIETGWVKQTAQEYFAAKAINASLIKEALISPKNILEYHREEKEAYHFGRAFHILILEPDKFSEMVRIRDGGINTQKFKQQLLKHDDSENMAFISAKEFQLVQTLAKEFKSYPEVKVLIKRCKYELSGYLKLYSGESYKIKVDGIKRQKKGYIFDVKTVSTDNLMNIGKAIANYKWDVSAGFYCWLATQIEKQIGTEFTYKAFYWICIEKTPPHNVKIYEAPLDVLFIGQYQALDGIHIIKQAKKTGNYKGEVESEVKMPYWYDKKHKPRLERS